jgi:hypothetical protein
MMFVIVSILRSRVQPTVAALASYGTDRVEKGVSGCYGGLLHLTNKPRPGEGRIAILVAAVVGIGSTIN